VGIVALVLMMAGLTLGQGLASAVIAVMYAGGTVLEAMLSPAPSAA
jgi:hypothetical protein